MRHITSDRIMMAVQPQNINARAATQESAMASVLNGTATDGDYELFPLPREMWAPFLIAYHAAFPGEKHTTPVGGMGNHIDLKTRMLNTHPPPHLGGELKVTKGKASPLEELSWQPWLDTVQFLQGQHKARIIQRFIGECGYQMLEAWYNLVVQPFSLSIPGTGDMTYAGYSKAMFSIGMAGRQEVAAVAFIRALRENIALKEDLHRRWLEFETTWLTSHTMNHEELLKVLREIIEQKDYWICVSRNRIDLIKGFKVDTLTFLGARPKPRGGMSFHYTLRLLRDGQARDVPLECKFHWKNGGQAVQNLNIMML
jgi:hypothetical protein